ncbi:TetR/AcrR family transcriptional regulator [Pseudonocardia ailaonensis]|uniref:TetR/AcrR family transcriptional regulator n=1 Tax=Pseudonocardia ailaonensis TaxID=367279 RepID=A0ABN2N3M5_9PSEU
MRDPELQGVDPVAAQDWRRFEPLKLPPVLRHALEAFAAHGYHGTSVRDIANRMGQTVPAIYYYYQNKQAILVALLHTAIVEDIDRCRRAVEEATGDVVAQLSNYVYCLTLCVTYRTELALLDYERRALEPENREQYTDLRDELQQILGDVVEQGTDQGRFDVLDTAAAVRALIAMCVGITAWYRPGGPLTPQQVGERYVDLALGMLRSTDRAADVLTAVPCSGERS